MISSSAKRLGEPVRKSGVFTTEPHGGTPGSREGLGHVASFVAWHQFGMTARKKGHLVESNEQTELTREMGSDS